MWNNFLKFILKNNKKLLSIYEELEFFSLIKKEKQKLDTKTEEQISLFENENKAEPETSDEIIEEEQINIIHCHWWKIWYRRKFCILLRSR